MKLGTVLSSVGALGYLVMEFDAVRAFDRPGDSWRFVFAIRPAF